MKIGTLFDLFTDSKDLTEFFEEVETPDQLVSRFEVLKRKHTDEFLNCLAGLRASLDQLYKETFEMSANLAEDRELDDLATDENDDVDRTLAELDAEFSDESEDKTEKTNSPPEAAAADPNTVETPNS